LNRGTTDSNRVFEVERKFAISASEWQQVEAKLLATGYEFTGRALMTDTFVPALVEGDMIRVRRETVHDVTRTVLTCKTWEHIGGQRERKEQEEEIKSLAAETVLDLGRRIQGAELLSFSKERDSYIRTFDGRKLTVSLDRVEGLGQYSGLYMEIELLVSNSCDVVLARGAIQQVLKELISQEREFVQMSYMEMLKKSRSCAGDSHSE
jgi:predicted adenylyl cyclase CyaB